MVLAAVGVAVAAAAAARPLAWLDRGPACARVRAPPLRGCRYVVPLLWLPVAAAFLWRGATAGGVPLLQLPALVAVGVLVWQLIEYSIHRCGGV